MKKVILAFFFLPVFLLAKFQVTTYFPLESRLVKTLAQNEVRIKEISNIYSDKLTDLPQSEISRLSSVNVYFHLGLDVEKKYAQILLKKNPYLKVIDLSKNIKKVDNNPYIWMDPFLLKEIITNLYNELCLIDKFSKNLYKENYERLILEVDKIFLEIKEDFYKSDVFNIYVFDDYWYYFASRFRVNLFKKDKKYLNITKLQNTIEFTKQNKIKKLLFSNDNSYTIAKSYEKNLHILAIEHNIFEENILLNLRKLSLLLF